MRNGYEMKRKQSAGSRLARLMSLALVLMLIASMTVMLAGCSKADADAEPETEEETAETAEEEDYSLYGDPSLGIDATVDEELRDYRNILVAGIDNGGRSDIMMILSINKETKAAKVIAVARDTYMQVADGETIIVNGEREYEFCKCNKAYEMGDKYAAMKMLNKHLDLNIREFIGIDWPGTATLIDDLGGLEADVDQKMLEWINKGVGLPEEATNFRIDSAGRQTLNGWQTVQYLRVRKYKGGGARRRETRNEEVMTQLFNQAKSMSISDLSDLYDDVASQLDTNMSRNTLTDTIVELSESNIEILDGNFPFKYKTMWDQDDFFNYLVPDTLVSNVKELHADLFGQDEYLPSMTVQVLDGRMSEVVKESLKKK